MTVGFLSIVGAIDPEVLGFDDDYGLNQCYIGLIAGHSSAHRKRKRRPVKSIFEELGPLYVRRAYRMTEDDFWDLLKILHPHLGGSRTPSPSSKKKHRNGAKNGLISSATRLSVALRYFAGGSPYDIAVVHGVSHSSVFVSVWMVVDAVNKCNNEELAIRFPTDHDAQRAIARGFKMKSDVEFDCCCGAIDGMLLWTEMPYLVDCQVANCEPKRFFCGRKKKFGLNLQAVCDHRRRFLDVSICHPASTSDYLSFTTSPLHYKLEEQGFLAKDVCLFGDNACVNTAYMATPFEAVRSGSKDACNFYQSQLRINIECAFGMLVNKFGILRKAMPAAMGLKKITATTICPCRTHNFCINRRLWRGGVNDDDDMEEDAPLESLAQDHFEIELGGGIPLERTENNSMSPEQLLHGGEQFDDIGRNQRRREERYIGGQW